ncbi:MAG TPA: hypothetical protein VGV37_14240 [Aliidongia sp.]|uniref:hypothetical protein n=1 Tax=Aliidongia sp. TaxID=1914230 RepID=UPI002DDD1D4C|nr:hypothetical protein [Aliidongia sp.]HEV2675700.1 hypothetical protein [Aliidongia sp.]
MVHTLDRRGSTPRTLFKMILMLGLVLVGVAALAAEPEPVATDAAPSPGCATTTFEFGGRIVQNGESTDVWTLTCHRNPAAEAAMPPATATPITAVPVATGSARRIDTVGAAQF